MTRRCLTCPNCQTYLKTKENCLKALAAHKPGNADHVVTVWNTVVKQYPCTKESHETTTPPNG